MSERPLRDRCSPAQREAGSDPPDAELLRRHRQGDPDAFRALFSRHKQCLWAVAIRMLGAAGPAAQAIEDAMILAFRDAPGLGDSDSVATWLYRMVVNACADRMRHGTPGAVGDDVMIAMRHLPVEQQSALVLVDMLGFSAAQASSVLGVSESALHHRCADGRARLIAELRLGLRRERRRWLGVCVGLSRNGAARYTAAYPGDHP